MPLIDITAPLFGISGGQVAFYLQDDQLFFFMKNQLLPLRPGKMFIKGILQLLLTFPFFTMPLFHQPLLENVLPRTPSSIFFLALLPLSLRSFFLMLSVKTFGWKVGLLVCLTVPPLTRWKVSDLMPHPPNFRGSFEVSRYTERRLVLSPFFG